MPIRTVFLSSTGADLTGHRRAVHDAIERLDGWHCVWMEDFGARTETAASFDPRKVAECDLFVGLIGHRHGHAPPPGDGPSYTEQEYAAAVTGGKPRLMFVASDDFAIAARLIEPDNTRGRQQAFRARVMAEQTVVFFDEAATLAGRVVQAIRNWEQAHPDAAATADPIFRVPYPRNPVFTGREDALAALHRALEGGGTAVVTQMAAVTGLGGIGKSQTALEYAYRHRGDYRVVWWIEAETAAGLDRGVAELAAELRLPDADPADPARTRAALCRWLERERGWLLILDNATGPEPLRSYLPTTPAGQVVITSRHPHWGRYGASVPIDTWPREMSIRFLAKRTGRDDPAGAAALAEALGDLPLALEQAAAYVEQTGQSFAGYLARYRERFAALAGDDAFRPADYPATVLTTWDVSLAAAERAMPAAGDLLRVLAFLAPDDIPRDLFGAPGQNEPAAPGPSPVAGEGLAPSGQGLPGQESVLPPALAAALADGVGFDRAVAALARYSLITATPEALSVHRLVQAVTRARLADPLLWADAALSLVNAAFPQESNDARSWLVCARLRPHAEAVLDAAEGLATEPAATGRLLNQLAVYLQHSLAAYIAAAAFFERALAIWEQALGADHPNVATSLNNLAELYRAQGRHAEAEPLVCRALAIFEQALGADHPLVATNLNNLALLYQAQGRPAEAEPLHLRALAIREQALGPDHPNVAASLNNLAELYRAQGRPAEAEPLCHRALAIFEQALGPDHPDVAQSLNNLALLYQARDRHAEAEPLFRRALAISEQALGPDHPHVAINLNNLGGLYHAQGRHAEAEPLFRRALAIAEKSLGPDHLTTVLYRNNLARLLDQQAKAGAGTLGLQMPAFRQPLVWPFPALDPAGGAGE